MPTDTELLAEIHPGGPAWERIVSLIRECRDDVAEIGLALELIEQKERQRRSPVGDITTPEQVPESFLRLNNLQDDVDHIEASAGEINRAIGRAMGRIFPGFDTDEENEAVRLRAVALRRQESNAQEPRTEPPLAGIASADETVTLPAAMVFEACARLAAVDEMFSAIENSAPPSIGDDTEVFARAMLRAAFDVPDEYATSDAWNHHATVVEYEASARERAGLMLAAVAAYDEQAEESIRESGRGWDDFSACGGDRRTPKGLREISEHLGLFARLIRLQRNAWPDLYPHRSAA